MKNMKSPFGSSLAAAVVGVAAFASSAAPALANSKPHFPPSAPEVGTWLIGAGIVALLGLDFLRRKFVTRTKTSFS